MSILVSDINLFSHGHLVYEINENGEKVNEVGIFTINSLGENMADYCHSKGIKKIKLFGNKDYINHMVVPDIDKRILYNYAGEKIDVEVIER